jgi:phosphoserine phosphatase
MIIAFDVDGTLIDFDDNPRWRVIELAQHLAYLPHRVIIWSGGGKDYAEVVARRLGFHVSDGPTIGSEVECFGKFDSNAPVVDIAFDDDTMLKGVHTLFQFKRGKADD